MTMRRHADPKGIEYQPVKRVRQACSLCRNRKVRCSGERPICAQCERSGQECVYIYDIVYHGSLEAQCNDNVPQEQEAGNSELLTRIIRLERRMDEMTGTANNNLPDSSSATDTSRRFDTQTLDRLPPYTTLASAVDLFFSRFHNQPFLLFHEERFRKQFRDSTLPRFLIYAVLACVLRFSEDPFFQDRKELAAALYAKLSWEELMQRWADVEEEENINAVQAMLLLASFDYTLNRRQKAWIKTGFAVRLALDLGINKEPGSHLDFSEREEHRRVFWSAYLMDRFATCARARPPVLRDEDCKLFLPCDEAEFRDGIPNPSHTLASSLQEPDQLSLNPFMMTIVMTSLLGRCTRYMLDEEKDFDGLAPWDSKSEFAAITSQLLLLEANFGPANRMDALIRDNYCRGSDVDHQQAGHVVLSRVLFHLCYCILHHPFLLRIRLCHFQGKKHPLLLSRLLESCRTHATEMCGVMQAAEKVGCHTDLAIYPYCLGVCGSIHAIHSHNSDLDVSNEANRQFTWVSNYLGHNSKYWGISGPTLSGLEAIKGCAESSKLLCSTSQIEKAQLSKMSHIWPVLDMASLSSPTTKKGTRRRQSLGEGLILGNDSIISCETRGQERDGFLEHVSMQGPTAMDFNFTGIGAHPDLADPFLYIN